MTHDAITMLPYPALPLGSRSWTQGHIDGSEQLSYVDIWFHRAALVRYKFTAHQNSSILLRIFFSVSFCWDKGCFCGKNLMDATVYLCVVSINHILPHVTAPLWRSCL